MSAQRDLFIQTYMPQAERVAAQLNVPVQGVLNHWGLETGWGKSIIPGTNNLGNIKDFSGSGTAATDNMTGSRDKYRQYASADDFATDYARMIGTNPRYAAALNTGTAYDFARGLQRGGYAEDPNFARKVAGMTPLTNNIVDDTAVMQAMGALPNSQRTWSPGGGTVRTQQIDPAIAAEMEQIREQKMAMLPYALAHSMSSNAGSQNFGQLMTALTMPAMEGTALKNGRVMPSGKYVTDVSDAPEWAAYAKLLASQNTSGLPGTISLFGYTPEGQRVVTSNKRGGQFTVNTDEAGNETFTPYDGPATPQTQYEKNLDVVTKSVSALDKANKLLSQVEKNPDAFSMSTAAVSKIPGALGAWIGSKVLPENVLQTRTNIMRDAAREMSELYGAAQSLGEAERAKAFIPTATDPADVVISKLKSMRDLVQSASEQYGQGMVNMAKKRSGQLTNQPQVGAPPAESNDRKEIDGVKYIKRNGQWFQE